MGTALLLYSKTSIVLILAQLQGMLPEGREDAVGAWLQTSLAAQQVETSERCWVSPSMLPLLYLAPTQEAVSGFSFSQFIWTSRLPRGRASLVSNCMTSGSSSSSPSGPWNGPGLHSLTLWLKGRNRRERTVPTSLSSPLTWRQEWHSQAG